MSEAFEKWDEENCRADNAQFTVGTVAREYARKAWQACQMEMDRREKRVRETCSVIYQWAGANDFPVEILDNLSILAGAGETADRFWHDELPVAMDIEAGTLTRRRQS